MTLCKAPGRICLFGDHQDYLQLPVIACAIDRYITLEAKETHLPYLQIAFSDLNTERKIPIPFRIEGYDPSDTLIAAVKVLRKYGCIPDKGYSIAIEGNIPINAGLSSSSALLVCWIHFLIQTFGLDYSNHSLNSELIAQIAYEAEVLEQKGPGGKMDQYAISVGKIIYLETDVDSKYQVIDANLQGLVIGESGISKDTLGLLADRRNPALESIEFFKKRDGKFEIKNITEDVLPQYLDELPPNLKPFFSAAVENHTITQKALREFYKEPLDFLKIGRLMSAHHKILKEALKITVPRIDAMVEAALATGALGAKIVGSGGGGCIVALAPGNEEQVIENMLKAGAVNAYTVSVAEGASSKN